MKNWAVILKQANKTKFYINSVKNSLDRHYKVFTKFCYIFQAKQDSKRGVLDTKTIFN